MPEEIQSRGPLPSAEDAMPPGGMALASGPTAIRPETGGLADVPERVRAAGEQAVRAYGEFLDDPKWSASTRQTYRRGLRGFFRWALDRGLTLEMIDGSALAAYLAETTPSPTASAIRGLFQHLVATGVLAVNPNGMRRPAGNLRSSTMRKEEFARIGKRIFGEGPDRKHRVARALGRRWNTVWCYEAGRRAIPAKVAEEVSAWDRLMDEAIARLDAETPEEKHRRFSRFMAGPEAASAKADGIQESSDAR